jgi:hypothetical protein
VTALWLDGIVSGGAVSDDILRPLTEKARLGGVSARRRVRRAHAAGRRVRQHGKKTGDGAEIRLTT